MSPLVELHCSSCISDLMQGQPSVTGICYYEKALCSKTWLIKCQCSSISTSFFLFSHLLVGTWLMCHGSGKKKDWCDNSIGFACNQRTTPHKSIAYFSHEPSWHRWQNIGGNSLANTSYSVCLGYQRASPAQYFFTMCTVHYQCKALHLTWVRYAVSNFQVIYCCLCSLTPLEFSQLSWNLLWMPPFAPTPRY